MSPGSQVAAPYSRVPGPPGEKLVIGSDYLTSTSPGVLLALCVFSFIYNPLHAARRCMAAVFRCQEDGGEHFIHGHILSQLLQDIPDLLQSSSASFQASECQQCQSFSCTYSRKAACESAV